MNRNMAPMAGRCMTPASWPGYLKPELFQSREVNVEIECESELTMGMTVVDWWRVTGKKPNATVCRSINAQGFFDLLVGTHIRERLRLRL